MNADAWVRLIVKEFRRGRQVVHIPDKNPQRLRSQLAYRKRKLKEAWRFQVQAWGVLVKRR